MNADGHEDELALRTGWSGGSDGCYICFLCVAIEEENRHKENRGDADMAAAICTRTKIFGGVYEGWHKWSLVVQGKDSSISIV